MNGVVIVAAGTGSRMNMGINKQFIKLEGKEIIAYTCLLYTSPSPRD